MKKVIYRASEGKTFRRKADGFIMGRSMILGNQKDGTEDIIDNYEEVEETEEIKLKYGRSERLESFLASRKEIAERQVKKWPSLSKEERLTKLKIMAERSKNSSK